MKAVVISLWFALGLAATSVAAEETLREGAREVGRATGSAVRDVGQGAKKVGKEVVQGTKEAGKAVGSAAAEGGREFKKAVKGEK
jgi:hypothetical protein